MFISDLINRALRDNAPMTERQFLSRELQKWMSSKERRAMITGRKYYNGEQDILHKERSVVDGSGKTVALASMPNNKIVDNRFDDLVDQKVNYLLAKPFTVESEDEAIKDFFTMSVRRKLKAVGKDIYMGGVGYVHPYIDGRGQLQLKRMKPEQVLPFWSDEEKEHLDAFAYVYEIDTYEGIMDRKITKVEFYDRTGVQYFVYENGSLAEDRDHERTANFAIDDVPYNWDMVPLIPFRTSEEEIPLVNKIKSLQDALNTMLSNYADNMQEDIRSTILVIKNYDGTELDNFRANLAQYGAIKVRTVDGVEGGVDSLHIDVNASNYEVIIKLLKKAIIENGRGFDSKDDRMSNNPNQMNIASMYSDIDLDANEMEMGIREGLERLLWFINTYRGLTGQKAAEDVEFTFNRDLPMNEGDTINNCRNSVGVISNETIIANHPWVKDVVEEERRLKAEQQSMIGADYVGDDHAE